MEMRYRIRLGSLVGCLMLVCPVGLRAETVCRVIDDYGAAVECMVARVTDDGEGAVFAETDEEGHFSITKELCEDNAVFRVEPKVESHFRSKSYACEKVIGSPTFTIIVTKKVILDNLKWNAKHFEERNACATAAMIHNDIYVRARAFDEALAEETRRKVVMLFARHLSNNTPMVYDLLQKKDVISPSLQNDIKKFQRDNRIPETGIIDMRTLRRASGTSMGQFMFRRLEE